MMKEVVSSERVVPLEMTSKSCPSDPSSRTM